MKRLHSPRRSSSIEILDSACVSDDLTPINLSTLPRQVKHQVDMSRAMGLRVVLVHWQTGQCAILPCPPGSDMPEPEMVINAYHLSTAQRQPSINGGAK